jgi:hypothetical protein
MATTSQLFQSLPSFQRDSTDGTSLTTHLFQSCSMRIQSRAGLGSASRSPSFNPFLFPEKFDGYAP